MYAKTILEFLDEKIITMRTLANNEQVQNEISYSNQEFDSLSEPDALINQREAEWLRNPKTITPFMESLMNNDAAMIVKAIIEYSKDDIAPIQSISITNAYGVNAILTEKTSDYIQGDKKWWNEAKKQGVHIMSGTNSDEPQRVYTAVVALTINDSEGNFVGVIKAIIVLEKTLSK